MNDFLFSLSGVLAHGAELNKGGAIGLLIVMSLIIFVLFIYKKDVPKGLFISSIIPYIIVTIGVLDFSFKLFPNDSIVLNILFIALYPGIIFLNTGALFFFAPFIADTLIIFGIIRLILFIRNKKLLKGIWENCKNDYRQSR